MLRVLIACEFSATVRTAFDPFCDAWSCDILETEVPGKHYCGNVLDIINDGWDLMIAHPPCQYLANSGVSWLHRQPGRWEKMIEGAEFFKRLWEANIPRICIENPIMHKYAKEVIGSSYHQKIQPWEFGHGEQKAVCLWLKGLSPLKPTNIVSGREQRVLNMSPSKDRAKERSRFYSGIASAMAEQWLC
jgi:hypothetical protein